jgi:SWIM zinc finger
MFAAPEVGSKIRVTTRYRNHYHLTAESEPFVDNVYEGVVLPSWKHDEPYTFNMTGTRDFPERNISLNKVVDLKILNGKAAKKLEKNLTVKAFKVESKGKIYLVTKADTKYTCTCIGFQYHRKCKHVTAVHKKVG